jgi:hypothetical protein
MYDVGSGRGCGCMIVEERRRRMKEECKSGRRVYMCLSVY